MLLQKKDGTIHPNCFTITQLRNNAGTITGFNVIIHDFSERMKLEKDLESSLNKYKGLFENANDIIYTLDRKGNFIDIDEKVTE